MNEFSVNKDMEKKNDKRKIPTYLLTCLLTLIVKLKISVKHGRLITTLNIIKH